MFITVNEQIDIDDLMVIGKFTILPTQKKDKLIDRSQCDDLDDDFFANKTGSLFTCTIYILCVFINIINSLYFYYIFNVFLLYNYCEFTTYLLCFNYIFTMFLLYNYCDFTTYLLCFNYIFTIYLQVLN